MTPFLPLNRLSPWGAHFCLGVESFLRQQAPGFSGGGLVAAFSGGMDSTALLVILAALSGRLGVTLTAAHLDHGLRPESGQDADWAAAFCSKMGIALHSRREDVADLAARAGVGVEEAGRRARYAFLEEVRQEVEGVAVVTAHHLDDLAEDALMRLVRGAGWPALAGMQAYDAHRRVLRPLLLSPKSALARLLTEQKITWREDPTNADQAFFRNRVRHQFLPLFLRENPDFLGTIAELWRQARTDDSFWQAAARQAMEGAAQPAATPKEGARRAARSLFVDNVRLNGCHQALRLRLYKQAVERLGPGQPLARTLFALDQAWARRRTGARFQFPGGKLALVQREGIRFQAAENAASVDTGGSGG